MRAVTALTDRSFLFAGDLGDPTWFARGEPEEVYFDAAPSAAFFVRFARD